MTLTVTQSKLLYIYTVTCLYIQGHLGRLHYNHVYFLFINQYHSWMSCLVLVGIIYIDKHFRKKIRIRKPQRCPEITGKTPSGVRCWDWWVGVTTGFDCYEWWEERRMNRTQIEAPPSHQGISTSPASKQNVKHDLPGGDPNHSSSSQISQSKSSP